MTPAPRALPRRTVLAASGTAVLAAAAACSSTPAATGTTSASTSAATSAASTPAAASTTADPTTTDPSSAETSAAESTEAASTQPPPTGTPLASVADVQAAGAVVVGPADNPILLAAEGSTVVAHTATCTHQGCAVAASGNCPCHGSRFNVTTGAVLAGPNGDPPSSISPLESRAVVVSGGEVYLA